MSSPSQSEDLERRKRVRLRLRPDLEESLQQYEGSTFHVFKDPASLRYHRFDQHDHFLIQLMDGTHTLEDIRVAFEAHFRPRRMTLENLEAFGKRLLEMGMVVHDSPLSGQQLYERRRKWVRREWLKKLTNILYIEVPIWNTDPILGRLLGYFRWAFSQWFLVLSVALMLASLLLVGTHWDKFWSKLPSAQEFFHFKNFVWLWVAIGFVKILHELGHGLACKHFGGEVNDMGALLLCLSPCIYVNVSDAWTFPDKWKRILVGLAGIYVELMIAAAATFLWWYSTEQWLFHDLALTLMIVCSVNTVLFNGNPLLRYDGYYVLADWLEIPNLRERSNSYVKHAVMQYCLGMEVPPEPGMSSLRRVLFVLYAIVSYVYGWVVAFSVILFVGNFLPYKLRIISYLMAIASVASMVGWPLYYLGRNLYQRGGKLPDMKPRRVWATAGELSLLIILFLFLPLPVSRIRQQALVQLRPEAVEKVFVPLSGSLERLYVRDGQHVEKGDLLAEFRNLELEGRLEEAQSQRISYQVQLRVLQRRAAETIEPQERGRLETAITQADGERRFYAQQEELHWKTLKLLEVRAPRAGVVLGAPRQEEIGKLWEKEQGVPLCSIGDPSRLRALVPVEPADYKLLKEEKQERGLQATIRVQGWGATTWRGALIALPESEAQDVPAALTTRCRGPLAVKPGNKPNTFVLQTQHYLVPVDFRDAEADGICPGTLAQVKIHCKWRSCAWWAWRKISQLFDLGLM